MDNEIKNNRNWIKKNWLWLILLVSATFGIGLLFSGVSKQNASDFGRALNDSVLFDNALKLAEENNDVQKVVGEMEQIDRLAILESDIEYNDNVNSVKFTVRVKGSLTKAKMDVQARKVNNKWEYYFIRIRIKDQGKEIVVLDRTKEVER